MTSWNMQDATQAENCHNTKN